VAAYDESVRKITLQADASLAVYTGPPGVPGSLDPNYGHQFQLVKLTGDHQVGLCTAITDAVIGVLQNKPQKIGEAATVAIGGVTLIQAGAALTFGQLVDTSTTGLAILHTTGTIVGTVIRGGGGTTGALVPVLLKLGS